MTLVKLIEDGRIHPTRIEETYYQAKAELDEHIRQAGEQAVFEANCGEFHEELVKILGRLRYRTSYGQNVLKHTLEVVQLAGIMAAELEASAKTAKRAALLHDLGKAMTHEVEGSHAAISTQLAKRYGESAAVCHAIQAHHYEVQPQTVEAVLLIAADAISASRPGARGEGLENYIKRLESLEELAGSHPGVEKVYALQAGREIRVLVKPEEIDDDAAVLLSHEIAREIEEHLEYPGQIKVTVIRESRAVDVASNRIEAPPGTARRRGVARYLPGMADETLTVTDNRTGEEHTLPIVDGAIRATDLAKLGVALVRPGVPEHRVAAAARSPTSTATPGILRYRGYPIEQLAEQATFLETAYLLFEGELPTKDAADEVGGRGAVPHLRPRERHEVPRRLPARRASDGDAARRGRRALDVLSGREEHRRPGEPLPAARAPDREAADDRRDDLPPHARACRTSQPRNDLDYIGNFVNMTFEIGGRHEPNPVLQRALEILLILHADHEQNCSTNAVRGVGSSQVDPFSAVSAGIAALYGPLHGGANEAVLRMLDEIGTKKNVPAFIESVKSGSGGRLMGFGHRVYKNYDPRAKLIKTIADQVFEQTGIEPEARDRARAGADRARGRVLRLAQALPERRLLLRAHLPGDGLPDGLLHRAVRARPAARLDRAVGGDAPGQGAEDRAPAAALHRRRTSATSCR